MKGRLLPYLVLYAAAAVALSLMIGERETGPDSRNYVLLTRSLVLDGDLFLANDLACAQKQLFVTHTGYPLEIHNLGVTLFWAPFYALARLLGGDATGIGPVYTVWLRFADWIYGLVAIGFTYQALRRRFPDRLALHATIATALGSSFVYYMGVLGPSSHMLSACLSAAFLYVFLQDRDTYGEWMTLGVLGGLALLVASTNVGLVALPFVRFLQRRSVVRGTLFAAFYVLAFLPQMIVWWLFLGSPLRSPYAGQLSLGHPHLGEILFSSYHGLFVQTPLLLLAVLGLFTLDRAVAAGALAAIALEVYLASSNLAWWGGASFGSRYLVGATPLFALGVAALWPRVRVAVIVCILWTAFLFVPYATKDLGLAPYYTLATQVRAALTPHLPGFPHSPYLFSCLPLFAVIAVGASRIRRLPSFVPFVPFVVLVVFAVITSRTMAAKRPLPNAIPSDVDQWDLAFSYSDRGEYEAARGNHAAAVADLRKAASVYPTNAYLRRRLAELERQR